MKAERIGKTPREQLKWVLRVVYPTTPLTEGDELNLLDHDLMLFAMGHAASVPVRSANYLRDALKYMRHMIDCAIAHREIEAERPYAPVYSWDESAGRYRLNERKESEFFETRITGKLGELLLEYGHLVKVCPAPAKMKRGRKPKDAPEETEPRGTCGNKFLALRENQIYCSSQCLDRALALKKREAEAEPPKPKGKKKKRK